MSTVAARHLKALARDAGPKGTPDLLQVFQDAIVDREAKLQIGRRMRTLRQRSPYTQEQLADMLGVTTRGYQKSEESGQIKHERLMKLAEIHKVDVNYFYEDDADRASSPDIARIETQLDELRELVTGLQASVVTLTAELLRQSRAPQGRGEADRPGESPGEPQ